MLQDRVSNPGPLTYESGALPIALRGPSGIHVLGAGETTGKLHENVSRQRTVGHNLIVMIFN